MMDKSLEKEILNRIETMESKDYVFPERFSKKQYTIAGICILICGLLLILGPKM